MEKFDGQVNNPINLAYIEPGHRKQCWLTSDNDLDEMYNLKKEMDFLVITCFQEMMMMIQSNKLLLK